jgi:hypothetical protein
MSNQTNPNEATEMLADHGLHFSDETVVDASSVVDVPDDELEFQPIRRTGLHWLTLVLIGLLLWGGGFLVGVLVDRALAG